MNFSQLLSENKLYSLNSTCNFCALKNLQFKFQEKNLTLNLDFEPRIGTGMGTWIAQLVSAPG